MEYFDLYDKAGQLLNKKVLRGTKLNDGEYHVVVNVWIRNKDNKYLIQQRNKQSDTIPFMWATTAGAVVAGDTSFNTAIKETKEELGINLLAKELQLVKRYVIEDDYGNYIMDIYIIDQEILLEDLVIDKSEVKACKYATIKEIKELIIDNKFWDYEQIVKQNDYFDLIEKS
jgi:isopentenyldiphosphate isomerase